MQGTYKTKEGGSVQVLTFDEPNNMAYVAYESGEKKWVAVQDASDWIPENIYIPDIPAQMTEEQEESVAKEEKVKNKRTKKDTDDTNKK